MGHRYALSALLAAAAIAPASFAASGDTTAGTYEGKGAGVKATVEVSDSGDGSIRYTLRTPCGNSRGTVPLDGGPGGSLKGKRSTRRSSLVAKLGGRDERTLSGSLKLAVEDRDGTCRSKRSFEARLDLGSSSQVRSLTGHYEGAGAVGGHPLSFDVGLNRSGDSLEISNLGFATDTECWDDLDGDGADDTLVARISGLTGTVDPDGYFEIEHSPDEDSDVFIEGTLADGEASMEIEVGGYFGPDGTLNSDGPYECDSWGETYTASLR